MAIRYVPIAAVTALLTATPLVAQPQTTTDQSTTTGTTTTQATPSTSSSSDASTSGTTSTSSSSTATTPDSSGAHATGPASSSTPGSSTSTGYDTAGGNDASTSGAASSSTGTMSGSTSTTGTSDTSETAEADAATSATTATGTAAGAAAGTMTAGSMQLQGQDATFLRKAVEGDRLEIASAQAALDQAQRTDTKNAARMILDDHRSSSEKLQSLASRKGWTLPSAGSADADQAMTSTSGSGSFDDRFLADQIRMHREAISLYRAQASGGSDPDLRQFARDQLPHLEHHLEMLQGSNTQK
jgi:putative membrane protein